MSTATLHEINLKGIEALKNALDPLELVRFFQQYELGHGNYTEERRSLYQDYTIDKICSEIEQRKSLSQEL
ncbi:MAG: hypothetical protein H7A25_15645 [Leptospiraceae bacterium]|nr:hypothetical protein [Leptospiraceae bacterium]MCP5501334.1 hypothetical protein [Leptospiraceae bacterium]